MSWTASAILAATSFWHSCTSSWRRRWFYSGCHRSRNWWREFICSGYEERRKARLEQLGRQEALMDHITVVKPWNLKRANLKKTKKVAKELFSNLCYNACNKQKRSTSWTLKSKEPNRKIIRIVTIIWDYFNDYFRMARGQEWLFRAKTDRSVKALPTGWVGILIFYPDSNYASSLPDYSGRL